MTNINNCVLDLIKLCIKNQVQLGIDYDGTLTIATQNIVLSPVPPTELSKVIKAVNVISGIPVCMKDQG